MQIIRIRITHPIPAIAAIARPIVRLPAGS
jgi:hypothetical protein